MGKRSEETFFWRRHFPKNHLQEKMLNMNNHQGNAHQNHKTHTCLDGYYQENKRLWHTEVPQKSRNRTTIWSSNSTSDSMSKGPEISTSKIYLHSHAHYSIIYNSWDMLLLLLSHFSRFRLCVTPWTAAHQAPPSLGFSRQEHWSGLPFPSSMHESEKWKLSRSVLSDS